MVEAVHTAVAGRTRYRVPELYRSESLKRLLELRLTRIKAISRVSASSLTGTLLVCYNTGNTEESIAELIAGIVAEHHDTTTTPPGILPVNDMVSLRRQSRPPEKIVCRRWRTSPGSPGTCGQLTRWRPAGTPPRKRG